MCIEATVGGENLPPPLFFFKACLSNEKTSHQSLTFNVVVFLGGFCN